MSRFFRGGDDSSSESSSDEEELYSEEEEEDQVNQGQDDSDEDSDDMSDDDSDDSSSDGDVRQGASKFLKDADSESEESDVEERDKVRSTKDKRLIELDASIKQIENGQKNGDWTLISAGMTSCPIPFYIIFFFWLYFLC